LASPDPAMTKVSSPINGPPQKSGWCRSLRNQA
jgi:hypothetical protein